MALSAKSRKNSIRTEQANDATKRVVIESITKGFTVKEALDMGKRSYSWYATNKKKDPEFARLVEVAKAVSSRGSIGKADRIELAGEFADFRRKFLQTETWPHQQCWVDLLEGKEPSWNHPSFIFEKGRDQRLLVNVPPNHPLALGTEVFTDSGFKAIEDVAVGDKVVDPSGSFVAVTGVSDTFDDLPMYRVTFSDHTHIDASGSHRWLTQRLGMHGQDWTTTEQIAETLELPSGTKRHRIPVADPHDGPEVDLPMDPYLFGYWLGDGCHSTSSIVGDEADIDELREYAHLCGYSTHTHPDSRGGVVLTLHGGRAHLRATGMFENKQRRIPALYFQGSFKQRLALLQGLMDSDGTISAKDSRARFVQVKDGLAEDVATLVASLGLMPHAKRYSSKTTTPQGVEALTTVNEVGFRTTDFPVFRLERKASRQKPRKARSRQARVIRSVERIDTVPSKCITVDNEQGVFLAGRNFVATGNSKSTTITIDYATWRICRDPNVRIIIISKTQAMAKKFLYGITSRLTHPRYAELQKTFAPEGGFKASADKWAANQIYLGGDDKDSGEPHPTVEALGIGGQVYGARADLIICDDCVTLTNAGEWEKQMDWLRQEASTRLGPSGKLLVIGTRVAPQDLYRELRNPDHYTDSRSPWTYFAQPAILGNAQGKPEDWETLWPVAERPFEGSEDEDLPDDDGNFPRWTGPRLAELRNDLGPSRWAMVYMQADVAAEPVFDPICVRGSVEGMRKRGPLIAGAAGHPANPEGFYIICSMDPAMAGETATIAYAVDRETQKRYVLDVSIMAAPTPLRIRELIHQWTELYKPNEWVIESNAFQLFLTQDEEIRGFLATRGIPLKPHHTGFNKQDAEFGVASLQPLFGTKVAKEGSQDHGQKHAGNNLISLPDMHKNEAVKALIEQLILWDPNVKTKHRKQDAVMALWFAELKAREVLSTARRGEQWFMENQFTSQRDRDKRLVIPLDEYAALGGSFVSL